MNELGIDLADRKPRKLAEWADVIVTMGCGDECPYVPGKRYVDWDLPDPAGRPLDEVGVTLVVGVLAVAPLNRIEPRLRAAADRPHVTLLLLAISDSPPTRR
jgi:hypothetical protein